MNEDRPKKTWPKQGDIVRVLYLEKDDERAGLTMEDIGVVKSERLAWSRVNGEYTVRVFFSLRDPLSDRHMYPDQLEVIGHVEE